MGKLVLAAILFLGITLTRCNQYGCDDVYAPVCSKGNTTYGNECEAEKEGVKSFTTGECPVESLALVIMKDTDCDFLIYTPVETFKPDTLEVMFRVDSLPIRIKYRKQYESFFCNNNQEAYSVIQILNVEVI